MRLSTCIYFIAFNKMVVCGDLVIAFGRSIHYIFVLNLIHKINEQGSINTQNKYSWKYE